MPAHIKVKFQLNKDKLNLLPVHCSPRKINEYLFEDRVEKSLVSIIEQADAHIICFGHTYKPIIKILPAEPSNNTHYRHAINIGSVGKLKDDNPREAMLYLQLMRLVPFSIKRQFRLSLSDLSTM